MCHYCLMWPFQILCSGLSLIIFLDLNCSGGDIVALFNSESLINCVNLKVALMTC